MHFGEKLDISQVKKDIVLDKDVLYFDYTASGLAYLPIEREILDILKTYANIHSQSSSNSFETTKHYDNSRNELKNLLGLDDSFYLMPCGTGSTAAIKKFQELLGIYIPPKTAEILKINRSSLRDIPLVIISPYEHHSNELSYRYGLCDVVRVGLDSNGRIDFNHLNEILRQNSNRKIIASFSVASNVTGIITDYKRLYLMVKSYGGIVALDACTYIPYTNLDCMFFDALFISGHKFLGGVGSCGILVIKKNLCTSDIPTFAGGGTVTYVSRVGEKFTIDKEELEQGGTPGIIQLIRAHKAVKLRNDIGFKSIEAKKMELGYYFMDKVCKIAELKLYGGVFKDRLPIFSFNVDGINCYDFAGILSQRFKIQTRAGCACAGPYGHDLLGYEDNMKFSQKPGWVRVGLHYTHEKDDIDLLVDAIKFIISKRNKIRFSGGRYNCNSQ